MFPFRDFFTADGKINNGEERCDEVSSTNDVFENVQCFEHNFDLDNIDPSLFCPDIILELGDTPIFTNNDESDGNQHEDTTSVSNCLDSKEENGKIMDAVAVDLTKKINDVKQEPFGAGSGVQYTKIHCTACNDHLGSALNERDNMLVHPLLKVLVCKECHEFYTSGEFEREEDGSETFCRWCGQGGQVVCCSKCEFVFCVTCIRINLGRKKLVEIKANDEWTCFSCDATQIIDLTNHCAEFMEYLEKETSRIRILANAQSLMNTDYTKCCSESENVPVETKKRKWKGPVDPTYDPYRNQTPTKRASLSKKILSTTNHLARSPTIVVPKEISCQAANIGSTASDSKNGMANVDIKKMPGFPVPIIKQVFNTPPSSSNLYTALPSLPQIITLPTLQKLVITNNKIHETPRNIPALITFKKTTINALEDLRHKKFFYERTIRSACNANSDISRELMHLGETKGTAVEAGLEGMVVAHNKLHDVLNKSIYSLMQVQQELAECKPENSNIKCMTRGTNQQNYKS